MTAGPQPGQSPCPSLLSSKGPFFNPTPTCLFPCGDNGQLDQRRWAPHIGLGVGLDRVIQALWAPGGIGPEAWVDSSVNGQEEQQGVVTVCGTADRLLGQPGFLSGRSGEVLLCVSPEPLLLHTPSLCHVEEDQGLAMKCGVRWVHSQLLWVFLRGQSLGIYPSLVLLRQREGPQGG